VLVDTNSNQLPSKSWCPFSSQPQSANNRNYNGMGRRSHHPTHRRPHLNPRYRYRLLQSSIYRSCRLQDLQYVLLSQSPPKTGTITSCSQSLWFAPKEARDKSSEFFRTSQVTLMRRSGHRGRSGDLGLGDGSQERGWEVLGLASVLLSHGGNGRADFSLHW